MVDDIREQIVQLSQQVVQLYQQRRYEEGLVLATQVRDLASRYLGEDHPAFATALNTLARLYDMSGAYAQAEPLYRQALAIRRTALGEDHSDYATSLNNLASSLEQAAKAHVAHKDFEAARKVCQEVVDIKAKLYGDKNWRVIDARLAFAHIEHLARLDDSQRQRITEAEQLNQKVVEFYNQGKYGEAIELTHIVLDIRKELLGEEHPDYARSLSNLASLYTALGDYDRAKSLYHQTLKITRKVQGKKHPDYGSSLNQLSDLYIESGDYRWAKKTVRKALSITMEVQGQEHPDYARSLNNLGVMYYIQNNYTRAEPLYRQVCEIWKKMEGGGKHRDNAASLYNLAWLYTVMGDYLQAESFFRQAAEIFKLAGEEHPDYARSLNSLGLLYSAELGDYVRAEPLLQQALEIYRRVEGEEHLDYAKGLRDIAQLYDELGDYARAEPLLQQALEIYRRVGGEGHPSYARCLSDTAQLYEELGDYTRAEPLLQQALEIYKRVEGKENRHYASTLDKLAELYVDMGEDVRAEPLLRQALETREKVLGKEHRDYAISLNHLGMLYAKRGDYFQAASLLRQALETREKVLGKEHPEYATSLNNLGALYIDMGDYARAELLYSQAYDIWRTTKGDYHPFVAKCLSNLALLNAAMDREFEALALMQQSLAIEDWIVGQVFSTGSESQRMAYLTVLQANFHAFMSLVLQYLPHSPAMGQAGLDLVLRRKAIGTEVLAMQRDSILGGRYPALAPKLHELTTLRVQIAQKTLAGPGLEGLAVHQQRLAAWNAQKDQLEAELARQIPEMNLVQQLRSADRGTVARALPQGAALAEFVRVDVIMDFKSVPARGDVGWKPARYLAFILSAGDSDRVQLIDLGEAEPIDQGVATFRATITGEVERNHADLLQPEPAQPRQLTSTGEADGNNTRHVSPGPVQSSSAAHIITGVALRRTIFDPLLTALGERRRLLLAPDGDLTRLPFEALPTDDGQHLIDAYQISYLGVGRDVLRFDAPAMGEPEIPLVVADPDFDLGDKGAPQPAVASKPDGRLSRDLDRKSLHFTRLPGTLVEGEQIAGLLDVLPLLGEAALETRIKASRSPRILHIATHGFFLADQKRDPDARRLGKGTIGGIADARLSRLERLENPLLRSGLALAGANTWLQSGVLPADAEDGILTAEDVSGLDLLTTDLVVLSACETGLGQIRTGEGVFGLRRSFVVAGVSTLIMSLWKVPDQQTQELMGDFYQRILGGQPRADALREAQLAMKARYPNPFYWGAFICQGEPGPLSLR